MWVEDDEPTEPEAEKYLGNLRGTVGSPMLPPAAAAGG